MRAPLAMASLSLGLVVGAARAGESVCWVQNGVLLVPAVAAGVNGVFILDTGAAQSQIDATQASEANLVGAAAVGELRLAGRTFPGVSMQVLALDARTRAFATPISGVLGSDILAGQVLEVRQNPCRLRLSRPGPARGGLAVELRGGAPYLRAGVSDGAKSTLGAFRIDTGSPRSVALAPGSQIAPADGRLRALAIGERLFENVPAAPRAPGEDGAAGAIGEPIWSRFTMRLDYARRTLTLTAPSPPPSSRPSSRDPGPAPPSGRRE